MINREDPAIKRLFQDVSFYTAPTDSQFRNYVERLIQEFKKLIRTGHEIPRNCPLPLSTIFELQLLFNNVTNLLNETPFALNQEADILCPNSFMKINCQSLQGPPLIKSSLPGINKMLKIIYDNYVYATDLRARKCLTI